LKNPAPLREEVAQAVQPLPHHAVDEASLEVLGEDRLHHLLGAEMALQQREVAAEDRKDAPVTEWQLRHREETMVSRPS
jgi:hypothetical protein